MYKKKKRIGFYNNNNEKKSNHNKINVKCDGNTTHHKQTITKRIKKERINETTNSTQRKIAT